MSGPLRFEDEPPVRAVGRPAFRLDRQNKKLMGVCSGIARTMGWDANLVRLGFVLATLLGFGSAILVYLVVGLVAD